MVWYNLIKKLITTESWIVLTERRFDYRFTVHLSLKHFVELWRSVPRCKINVCSFLNITPFGHCSYHFQIIFILVVSHKTFEIGFYHPFKITKFNILLGIAEILCSVISSILWSWLFPLPVNQLTQYRGIIGMISSPQKF